MSKTVLVTGSCGMIGSAVVSALLDKGFSVLGVDRCEGKVSNESYCHVICDLSSEEELTKLLETHKADRVVHLAALAHNPDNIKYTYDDYYKLNVECACNVFSAAAKLDIPVLFASTADVYGFTKEPVTPETEPKPVSDYAKTKYQAELKLKEICASYSIYRFAPVYTETVKRDIQKRYYLKYSALAYIVGKGIDYEFLSIEKAAESVAEWVGNEAANEIRNIKDKKTVNTAECLRAEKEQGRAKLVLHIPFWVFKCAFSVLKAVTGENNFTYLLSKVVYPLRTLG